MKFLELDVSPTGRAIHPIDQALAEADAVTRAEIVHVDAGIAETTLLYRLEGDPLAFETLVDDHDDVTAYEVVAGDDAGFDALVRVDPDDDAGALVGFASDHALILDTPIECRADGLVVTVAGTQEALQRALTSTPDALEVSIRDAGQYAPTGRNLLTPLTERQLEVFRTAVDQGYYEVPRRATHRELAETLDCSPSTIDEHLRKAESRVVSGLLG